MENIIGITGLPACGKTYLARYIGEATGIEVVEFDDNLAEMLNSPILSKLLGKGKENIKASDFLETFEDMTILKKIEIEVMRILTNRKLKSITKNSEKPLIVDFCFLPLLKVAKKFDENYLVEDINNQRFAKRFQREGTSENIARRIDSVVGNIVDFSSLDYTSIIPNDYETIPNEVCEIVERINQRHFSDEMVL